MTSATSPNGRAPRPAAKLAVGVSAAPSSQTPVVHDELAEVRLIDAKTAAQIGGMGLSWWFDKVAAGVAPTPVYRAPRCTRWRAADVAAFWRAFAEQPDRGAEVLARARKASAASQARQREAAAERGEG